MKVIGVIPARYESSRFPGKPLVNLNGIPMIIRVIKIVEKALGKENTYVATDDQRIIDLVTNNGFKAILTSPKCLTGTDRIYDFSKKINSDIYINIQGDEPLLDYKDIKKVVKFKLNNIKYVINAMCNISSIEDPKNLNIPKVVVNKENNLIYMSRLPIPGTKKLDKEIVYKKQVCIYAFTKNEITQFGKRNKKSEFEKFEDIEILRFLDLNIPVKMINVSGNSLAVDIPSDVIKVEEQLKKNENKKKY